MQQNEKNKLANRIQNDTCSICHIKLTHEQLENIKSRGNLEGGPESNADIVLVCDRCTAEASSNESSRMAGAGIGGAMLGASLGGPMGAVLGGLFGLIMGDSVNKNNRGGRNG